MLVRSLAAYTVIIEGFILFTLIAGRRKTPDTEFRSYNEIVRRDPK